MVFTLEALQAKHGDSLLLHYGPTDNPELVLIDGGPSGVWGSVLKKRLEELREDRLDDLRDALPIRLMMVSHIDDDHIRGILDLTKILVRADSVDRPLHYAIEALWHNSFDDIVGTGADRLETAARAQVGTASTGDDVTPAALARHQGALVLASVRQGRQLRNDANKLALSVNPGGTDGLIVAHGPEERPFNLGHGLNFRVLGPRREQVVDLQRRWDAELERLGLAQEEGAAEAAAYLDGSVFNLSSIVVLAEAQDKTILLTGDARGDYVLDGLRESGLLDEGRLHVDILKLPHHGSDRNVETDFFRTIIADHYVVSGDGKHHNPEIATLEMLFTARAGSPFTLYLTYPVDDFLDDYPKNELKRFFERKREDGIEFTLVTPQSGKPSVRIDLLDPYEAD